MELLDFVAAKFHEEAGVFKLLVGKGRKIPLTALNKYVICFLMTSMNVVPVVWCSLSHGCQVIDSIMALFRVDFSGRGELAERQQKLAQMLSRLQKISEGVIMWRIIWHKDSDFKFHNVPNHADVFGLGHMSVSFQSIMLPCLSPTRWQLILVQECRKRLI